METPEAIAASSLQRRAAVDISSALSRGWALVRDHMLELVGATVLGWLVTVGLAFVPILGWIVGFNLAIFIIEIVFIAVLSVGLG